MIVIITAEQRKELLDPVIRAFFVDHDATSETPATEEIGTSFSDYLVKYITDLLGAFAVSGRVSRHDDRVFEFYKQDDATILVHSHRCADFEMRLDDLKEAYWHWTFSSALPDVNYGNGYSLAKNAAYNLGFRDIISGFEITMPTGEYENRKEVVSSEDPTQWLLGKNIFSCQSVSSLTTTNPNVVGRTITYGIAVGEIACVELIGQIQVNKSGCCFGDFE